MSNPSASIRGRGLVTARVINRGSKSERTAVEVETDDGPVRLARLGGNPFHDPVLHRLIGATIEYEGRMVDGVLVLDRWTRRPG